LGLLGGALELIEESPPKGPGTAVVIVFRDGEVEVLEDLERCLLDFERDK
jgi:hypothetical protein